MSRTSFLSNGALLFARSLHHMTLFALVAGFCRMPVRGDWPAPAERPAREEMPDFADARLGPPDDPRTMPAVGIATPSIPSEVSRWDFCEFELTGICRAENPYLEASLRGSFTAPSGKVKNVDGFYDGDNVWRLRFAPDEEGEWRYEIRGENVEIHRDGRLQCLPPKMRGFIGVHPENPYAFARSDGTAFFPMGDTCYGLYDDSTITPALRNQYLETRRREHFNFVRMNVGHSAVRAAADPAYWAWGGSPVHPDLDRFNPAFFHGLDELLRDLGSRGMNVELIALNFYRAPFNDAKLWSTAHEKQWLRYLVARYAAFDNLFLWTLANEYETHPDGRYRLDRPADIDWVKATAQYIKQIDPYHHLVTVHPVVSSSTHGVSPRDPFDPPWRIGGFFGAGPELDVLSQQTGQHGTGVTWDDDRKCWIGDPAELTASLRADRDFGKPVINTENGYEYLRGHPTEHQQVHSTEKVRHSSWRIVCSGGYFAAGFSGTVGHGDAWNRIDAPNRYDFTMRDEGAPGQLATLYEFFSALPFWRMQPMDILSGDEASVLAEPGRRYVAYLPHGGSAKLDLTDQKRNFTAHWFNPRDGKSGDDFAIAGGKVIEIQAPDVGDWALLIGLNSQ